MGKAHFSIMATYGTLVVIALLFGSIKSVALLIVGLSAMMSAMVVAVVLWYLFCGYTICQTMHGAQHEVNKVFLAWNLMAVTISSAILLLGHIVGWLSISKGECFFTLLTMVVVLCSGFVILALKLATIVWGEDPYKKNPEIQVSRR